MSTSPILSAASRVVSSGSTLKTSRLTFGILRQYGSNASNTSSTPGLNDANLYGPAPMGAFLKPSGRRRLAHAIDAVVPTPQGEKVRIGSNSAVPSTIEHSRSTFNCGRTVTLPSRPEVAEPQNRKREAVDRRRIETPYKPLNGADVARNTGTAAEREAKRAAVP